MKRLILVRHAKSSWATPGLEDFDRPLNGRGKRDAPAMGKRLAGHKMVPDKIISSPAARAIATASELAAAMHYPVGKIRQEAGIYEASAAQLLAIVRDSKDKWGSVMLVGHMPGLGELASLLTGADVGHVPTCCVMQIDIDCDSWSDVAPGTGRLVAVMTPRDVAI